MKDLKSSIAPVLKRIEVSAAPEAAFQLRLIWLWEAAVAFRPVGADGGESCGVAEACALFADSFADVSTAETT